MERIVVGGKGAEGFAKMLARRLHLPYQPVKATFFPDGELKIRVPPEAKDNDVILVNSMHPDPGEVLMECLFSIGALRQMGISRLTVVIPYLGFMRQDKAFHPGEAVSNRIVAGLLDHADRVITMDPHLHRIVSLKDIFKARTVTLTADNIIAKHISHNHPTSIIIGPDEESSQWAADIAKKAGVPFVILKKKRYNSEKVSIKLNETIPLKGRDVVLVDDIISTGHTMMEPIKQLKRKGVRSITCIGVHGIFAGTALKNLKKLGAKVEATNTIANPVAVIDVVETFAGALK
jgi:ribose-phosphate pyrophosphokinase